MIRAILIHRLLTSNVIFIEIRETQGGLAFQFRIPNIPHKESSIRAEPEADRKINCSWLPCQASSTSLPALWISHAVCEGSGRKGLWLVCLRCRAEVALPLIQHVVLIGRGRVEEQPVPSTNRNTVQYKH